MAIDLPKARMEHWRIIVIRKSPSRYLCLLGGTVTGHGKVRNGQRALSSRLIEVADDSTWARTHDTYYELGKPMPAGEELDDDLRFAAEAMTPRAMTPDLMANSPNPRSHDDGLP